ncbi:MAG: TonB-dependent receptor [Emcibacter sp.]|nr:TonB-dependent receptor [Emcibacter sp.]
MNNIIKGEIMKNFEFKNLRLVTGVSAIALGAFATTAAAQEAVFDEIIVTAQKKSESVQTVPIAISTFSSEEMKAKGIFTIGGLEINTPGFTFDELGTGKVRTAIRGIGSDNTSPGQEFSTVIFLDGVAQSTNGLAAVNLFDIERVEVLKGPQGTLWGKGAIGGGINIITARPTDENSGRVSLTAGNHGLFDVEGIINNVIGDNFRQRLAGSANLLDGYATNAITGDNLENLNRVGLRYSAELDVSERTSFGVIADYTRDDNNGRNYQILGGTPGGSREATWNQLVENRTNDPRVSLDDDVGFAKRKLYGVRTELNVDLDWMTFTNVTSYRNIEDSFFDNNDGATPEEIAAAADAVDNRGAEFGLGTSENSDQFSTEFRFSGAQDNLEWTTGAYYGQDNGNQLARFQIQQIDCRDRGSNPSFTVGVPMGSTAGDGCTTGNFSEDRWNISNTTNTYAAFGELTYNVTDALSVTGGLRYSSYKKDYSSDNLQSIGSTIVSGAAGQSANVEASWNKVTYRLIADYQVTDDIFAYLSYATGFAPGDFGAFTSQIGTVLTPQEAKSLEFGLKGSFNKFQFNTAVFYNDFSGTPVVQVTGVGGGTAGNTQQVKVKGFEIDMRYAATDALRFDVKYSYLNTDADGTPFGDDLELQRAPKHDITIGATYYVTDDIEIGGGYSYRSEVFDDPDNNLGEVRPSRQLVDAHVKWDAADGLVVRVWGRNLTDENYVVRISDSFQSRVVNYGAPRSFGITVSKDF